jgi:6-phosphogluconate dehydrogenase
LEGAYTLKELLEKLEPPRTVWMMIPAGSPVDKTIEELTPILEEGDILVDGGNSNYHDSIRRSKNLSEKGINYVDVGTSGGIWGLTEGYSMMVGGGKKAVERLRPVLETLAPGVDEGWGHVGPAGAGHFVKMIHNGIEYGLMQAYAEGFAIMKEKEDFDLDLHKVAEIWRVGSVVRSWLLDLISDALSENQELEGIAPYVEDSGEGRWTVSEALDLDVAAPVITLSLLRRFMSRDKNEYSSKLLAAMRNKFGGHTVRREN